MQYKFKVGDVVSGVITDQTTGVIVETLESGIIEDLRHWTGKPAYTIGNGLWLETELNLIESKNMFKIGPYNPELVRVLLEYIEAENLEGLCKEISFNFGPNSGEKKFLLKQEVFKNYERFPIEIAIGKLRKRSREKSQYLYLTHENNNSQTSPKHAEGRLRRWWAYNLAVAASNIENLGV